jgi:uncharacterized membrane protein YfcA
MHPLDWVNPLYSLSGFVVGLLVGQTGMGGGALMTPLLILLFGVHPAAAVGTDLLYASVTKTFGTAVHGSHGTVNWRIVARLAAGSVPATALALLSIARFHLTSPAASQVIASALGFMLLLTALCLLFRRRFLAAFGDRMQRLPERQVAAFTVAVGCVLGVLVTISSVGAGAVGVTALLLLYPRLPMATIVGSDIAHAVPLTLLGGVGHWWLGSVDTQLLVSLLVGSIPGIVLGSWLAVRVPDIVLRPIMAGTLVLIGMRLVF